ncbi:MAG: hypothetical protein RL885_02170 [Planctomycetota bacterium]
MRPNSLALLVLTLKFLPAGVYLANHPVLVEGETDFDGHGLIGMDEDLDGDRIFGTFSVVLASQATLATLPTPLREVG